MHKNVAEKNILFEKGSSKLTRNEIQHIKTQETQVVLGHEREEEAMQ